MAHKTFREFHHSLSWATRIYTLLVFVTIIFSEVFHAWDTNWVMTIIAALTVILFVESFAIVFHKYPRIWLFIRFLLILALLTFTLISFDIW